MPHTRTAHGSFHHLKMENLVHSICDTNVETFLNATPHGLPLWKDTPTPRPPFGVPDTLSTVWSSRQHTVPRSDRTLLFQNFDLVSSCRSTKRLTFIGVSSLRWRLETQPSPPALATHPSFLPPVHDNHLNHSFRILHYFAVSIWRSPSRWRISRLNKVCW